MRNTIKKYSIQIILIFIPFGVFCQSVREATSGASLETIERSMSVATVNTAHLQSFQNRAEQKLKDFIEIVSIISDKDHPIELRRDIATTAADLFLEKNTHIHWHYFKNNKSFALPLTKFLEKIIREEIKIKTVAKKIENNQPLNCPAPQCVWQLTFQVEQSDQNGNTHQTDATMDVILKLETKKFGDEEREIWTLFLGELNEVIIKP